MESGGEGLSEEMERHQDEEEDEAEREQHSSQMETSSEEDESSGSEEEEGEEEESGEEESDDDGEEGEDGEEWETSSETSESEESDSTDGEDNGTDKPGTSKSPSQPSVSAPYMPPMEDISDLSDGETERCPVCLSRFTTQSIGMPESCDHAFCLECITEWSKNVNTCPKDRQVFRLILVRHDLEGPIIKRIKVEDKQQQEEIPEEEDHTCCEVCGRSDREDRLLLCDGCDLAYHCECLDPPLYRVPSDEWFCPDCTSFGVAESIQIAAPSVTPRRTRQNSESGGQRRRLIARTLVAERVRSAIAELRSVRGRRRIVSDSDQDSDENNVVQDDATTNMDAPVPSTATPRARTSSRKKTVKRKTRKRRKRKTTKRKTSKNKTTGKSTAKNTTTGKAKTTKTKRKTKRKTRRKKKGKKRKVRTVRSTPKTPKTRLADALGLKTPPKGRTIPTMRSNSLNFDRPRSDFTLTILGDRDELDPYFSDSDNETMAGVSSGSTMVARPNVRAGQRSRASLKSHAVIRRHSTANRREVSSQAETPVMPFDLLGNILAGQDILHLKGDQVMIKRDGTLKVKKPTEKSNGIPGEKRAQFRETTSGDNGSNSPPDSPTSGNGDTNNTSGNNSLNGSSNSNSLVGGSPSGAASNNNNNNDTGEGHPNYDGQNQLTGGDNGHSSDSDTGSNHGQTSDGDSQDKDAEGRNENNDEDSPSRDSNGADSDSVNNSPTHNANDNSADGDKSQSPSSPNYDDANQFDSQGFNPQTTSNDSKNEELYDPASPSDSQDGESNVNKSDQKEEEKGEEEAKDKEEYDPFAPTSDQEDNAAGDHQPSDESREDDGDDKDSHEEQGRREDEEEEPRLNEDEEEAEREQEQSEEEFEEKERSEDEQEHRERPDEEGVEVEEETDVRRSELEDENAELEHDLHAMLEDSDDDDMKMVPISELPRIPKRKRQETTENEVDVPTRSVLERASLPEKQDSFPRWEKRDRAYRERDRGDRDKGDREEKKRKHREPPPEEEDSDTPRPRRRHKHREHDREREREREKEKAERYEWDTIVEEVIPSTSSRHKHKKRSRSRSKERRRSRRSRSRSHERTGRRRHEARASRSRSRDREVEKSHRKRSRSERERKHQRSHSPHHRDRDHRDKEEREGERGRRSIADVFKGSVKMFSQSLKEASDVENTGRRFKLKRNFYQENTEHVKKSRYEETESTYERRSERPEVKSAVVKPCAVQDLFDSDGEDCEIIGVEIKGIVHKDHKGVPPKKPERKILRNPPRPPITIDLVTGADSPPQEHKETPSKPTNKTPSKQPPPPPPPPVPANQTPQKPESKVTFKLPDKKAKSTNLVQTKINIFESDDDDEEEEDYDPFEPTDPSSPQSRPKEPPSPKDDDHHHSDSSDEEDRDKVEEEKGDESKNKESPSRQSPSSNEEEERSPSPPKEDTNKKAEEPKAPKTPPLPVASPGPEPKSGAQISRGAARLEAPLPDQPAASLANPQNMVLQQIGSLPLLQQGIGPASSRPVLMNHMLVNGPPPPHPFPQVQNFPPGRMWAPNVILRSRLHPSLSQNGGPPEHMRFDRPPPPIPGMRPGMPPPPPPGAPPLTDKVDLATPPPPLPTKALEEMEQISQLLNARVVQPGSLQQAQQQQSSSGGRKESALFKVPMPPPPLPGNKENSKNSTDLDMEVVDMDVASPLSDDDNLMSFSPPPLDEDRPWDKKRDRNDKSSNAPDMGKDDDVPTSAVELDKRQKYMKKLNRQERVVEEVKLAIKPHYSRGKIDKEEYKEILRKAVPKICHSKSGDINSAKIRNLIAAYVEKVRKMRKYEARKAEKPPPQLSTSSAKANGQKRRK